MVRSLSDDPGRRIGETGLINLIWEHWIGKDRTLQRDRLLRELGQHEGEKLSGAVSVDAIKDVQSWTSFRTLSNEDLVRIKLPSVRFTHDLIGDWARFRALSTRDGNAISGIRSLVQIPRWNRAIRLYAQSLLEGKADLADWKKAMADLDAMDAESRVAKDLFLEALIFAADPMPLLEAAWPDLVADKGKLLNRLMDRLLFVASFPDPRFRSLVTEENLEASESWFRIPMPLYWIPTLLIFAAHSDDVAKVAMQKGAEVCALYLRNMPAEMPGRKQAARLALVLARELQDLVAAWPHVGDQKVIYEAMLLGAGEDPDSVAQVALEIAARRPEPDHAIKRREHEEEEAAARQERWRNEHPKEYEQHRASVMALPGGSYFHSRRRTPLPDGPQRRIPEGFRKRGDGLGRLDADSWHSAPKQPRRFSWRFASRTLDHRDQEGPIRFLRTRVVAQRLPTDLFQGAVLYLPSAIASGCSGDDREAVEYRDGARAESRGSRPPPAEQRERYALKFTVKERTVYWFGNGQIYNLHRSGRMHDDVPGLRPHGA